jgi:hypothetical protein
MLEETLNRREMKKERMEICIQKHIFTGAPNPNSSLYLLMR